VGHFSSGPALPRSASVKPGPRSITASLVKPCPKSRRTTSRHPDRRGRREGCAPTLWDDSVASSALSVTLGDALRSEIARPRHTSTDRRGCRCCAPTLWADPVARSLGHPRKAQVRSRRTTSRHLWLPPRPVSVMGLERSPHLPRAPCRRRRFRACLGGGSPTSVFPPAAVFGSRRRNRADN
jgi:hypothetical protein